MTTLAKEKSPERLEMLKSQPILKAEDIAEAVCYVLSTPEGVQVLCTSKITIFKLFILFR